MTAAPQKPKQFNPPRLVATGGKFDGRKAITDLYDARWSKYRFRFLHHNPTCYACGGASEVVDHVVPHKGNRDLFWKADNYIPLCHQCHNYCTASFDKNFGPNSSSEPKLTWLKWSRAKYSISTKVVVVPLEDK